MEVDATSNAFAGFLGVLQRTIPDSLINAANWDPIVRWSRGLPVDPGILVGLELHLSDLEPFAEPFVRELYT